MKFKTLAQMMLVSLGLLGLVGCSSLSKHSDEASVADADGGPNGAQSAGLGDGNGFNGEEGRLSPQQLLAKHTYYFDFDRSEVHGNDRAAVLANADYIVAHPNTRVLLEGHTDPRGSREYNVALGERRANTIAEMLKAKGVNPGQVRVVSYGAERLAAPGHDEADYRLDRRVVLVYLRK